VVSENTQQAHRSTHLYVNQCRQLAALEKCAYDLHEQKLLAVCTHFSHVQGSGKERKERKGNK